MCRFHFFPYKRLAGRAVLVHASKGSSSVTVAIIQTHIVHSFWIQLKSTYTRRLRMSADRCAINVDNNRFDQMYALIFFRLHLSFYIYIMARFDHVYLLYVRAREKI